MNKEVVNQIKQYRSAYGMTQQELGQLVGVSRQSIISIEQGRYIPSLPLALKLARVFDCTTDELFQLMEDTQ
jgi:putative transcriptional regulator